MNRKVVICLFVLLIIIFLWMLISGFFYSRTLGHNENETKESDTEKVVEEVIQMDEKQSGFWILERDESVIVYDLNTKEYMETGIEYEALSDEMKEKIGTGFLINSEEDLIDFLESYSS